MIEVIDELIFIMASHRSTKPIERHQGAIEPSSWAIDELTIGLIRSILVRGARIAVPTDDTFAPLAAQVALQYLSLRFAEDTRPRSHRASGLKDARSPLLFVGNRFISRERSAPDAPGWMQLFSQVSGYPAKEMTFGALLQTQHVSAAISIGRDEIFSPMMDTFNARKIPIWHLQDVAPSNAPHSGSDVHNFQLDADAKLESARKNSRYVHPEQFRQGQSDESDVFSDNYLVRSVDDVLGRW